MCVTNSWNSCLAFYLQRASRFDSVVLLLLAFLVQIHNTGFKNKQAPKTTATKSYRFSQKYVLDKKMCVLEHSWLLWDVFHYYGVGYSLLFSNEL